MTLYKWSQTAANNGNADSTCPFPEGMSPAAVNDGTRGMMAAVAKYRDDISGVLVTGGAVNAYTITSYQGFDSLVDMDGKMIAFSPHVTSTGACQLNVDGFGLKGLRPSPGVDFLGGELILGTPYTARFSNADGCWYVHGFMSSPFAVPFLGGMDLWDTVAPNSAFIFPMGQAISRTVYARAFARWGTKFGAGDGSTTFNVPDKTGRVSAMIEAAATRLTSGFFGADSTQIGSVGGAEHAPPLTLNNLPTGITAANTAAIGLSVSSGAVNLGGWTTFYQSGTSGNYIYAGANGGYGPTTSTGNIAIGGAAVTSNNTGSQAAGGAKNVETVQPTITCNYVIRIL